MIESKRKGAKIKQKIKKKKRVSKKIKKKNDKIEIVHFIGGG